jgi:ketosteroid isomerase-like protein
MTVSFLAASDVAASHPAGADTPVTAAPRAAHAAVADAAAHRPTAPDEPAAVVDRYLAAVSDLAAEPAALAALIDPDARFVEHPNLVAPSGRRRDAAAALAAREHSRRLLACHRFDVQEHIVAGDRVVTRATWTGTLAIDAGTFTTGSELRAECCMVFTVRDGRIVHQENYDCYGPLETA